MKDEVAYQQKSGLGLNQQRWPLVLALGCLPDEPVSPEVRPMQAPPAAFVVMP